MKDIKDLVFDFVRGADARVGRVSAPSCARAATPYSAQCATRRRAVAWRKHPSYPGHTRLAFSHEVVDFHVTWRIQPSGAARVHSLEDSNCSVRVLVRSEGARPASPLLW